jgi:hypothetical protein
MEDGGDLYMSKGLKKELSLLEMLPTHSEVYHKPEGGKRGV